MRIRTTIWYYHTPTRMNKIWKTDHTTCWDTTWWCPWSSHTRWVRTCNGKATLENSFFLKGQNTHSIQFSHSTPRYLPKRNKSIYRLQMYVHKCAWVFIEDSFVTIAQTENNPNVHGQVNDTLYNKYHPPIKRNKLLTYAKNMAESQNHIAE